jgi:hypothetical protein
MNWQSVAWLADGSDSPRKDAVDALVANLASDHSVLAALSSSRFEMTPFLAKMGTVVLTNEAILVAKDRLFGRPKTDLTVHLSNIRGTAVGPLLGVGPTWEVAFQNERGVYGTIYFQDPANAERFERELRSAIGRQRAEAADPDLAEAHRALALAQAQPDGDVGKSMGPDQVTAESRQLREHYDRGNYGPVWARRVELGYGVPTEGVAQSDAFWLNAAPALAALKTGMKEHPMVAMCCGVAESEVDRDDPAQVAAVDEFNHLYFR